MSGTALQATTNHYRPNMGGSSYRSSSGLHSMDTDDSDGLDVVGLDDHHHRSHHDSHHRYTSSKFIDKIKKILRSDKNFIQTQDLLRSLHLIIKFLIR